MSFPPLVEPLAALADDERVRTSRHRVLAGFGDEAQRRLAAAHVAIVGAGGLGSPSVLALAAAGVGTLTIVDDDDVELSNLQRQVLHRVADVGAAKVDSAVRIASELSPHTVVRPVRERLTSGNAERILAGAHVVIDGSDTFETREVVASACERLGIPLVWGVVQEFHAQVTVFWSAPPVGVPAVRLADLYPPASVGETPTCAQVGVLGSLCLQVGGLLATEAIKLVTGIGEPLLGRVLVVDALRGRFDEVPLRAATAVAPPSGTTTTDATFAARATLAPAHGATATRTDATTTAAATPAVSSPSPSTAAPHAIPQLDSVATRAAQDAGAVIVDVREPHETATGVIPGSVELPLAELLADPRAAGAGPVVVVCQAGVRAQRAARALRAAGIAASVLAGGIEAWDGAITQRTTA